MCLSIYSKHIGAAGARVLALRPHEGVNLDQSAADTIIDNLADILTAL